MIIGADGVIRWTWRSGQRSAQRTVPMPREVLAVAVDLLGTDG